VSAKKSAVSFAVSASLSVTGAENVEVARTLSTSAGALPTVVLPSSESVPVTVRVFTWSP
jgi:hypothetical protein